MEYPFNLPVNMTRSRWTIQGERSIVVENPIPIGYSPNLYCLVTQSPLASHPRSLCLSSVLIRSSHLPKLCPALQSSHPSPSHLHPTPLPSGLPWHIPPLTHYWPALLLSVLPWWNGQTLVHVTVQQTQHVSPNQEPCGSERRVMSESLRYTVPY